MFSARFFPAYGVTIFCAPGCPAQADDLLDHRLLFVWDELGEPERVRELLGRYAPFAPAALPNYARRSQHAGENWTYALAEREGATTLGFVLLGLTDAELAQIDDYEGAPIHKVRYALSVRVGDIERVAGVYLAAGSYLGE
jgi:hypothetical protein